MCRPRRETDDEQRLAAIESAALGMEFSFQAQDHNALAISIVRFLVALPPVRDLLLCAKHLFVAAMVAAVGHKTMGWQRSLPSVQGARVDQ